MHLACHGFFLSDNPDFAGLHVTSGEGRPEMLWYSDVARERSRARLVTLGACYVGTGEVRYGSEYVGLPGAFLASGAHTVLAPLNAVDDEVTARLMAMFYPAYLDSGSPARALRQARLSLATEPSNAAHERSWTAFQIFGLP